MDSHQSKQVNTQSNIEIGGRGPKKTLADFEKFFLNACSSKSPKMDLLGFAIPLQNTLTSKIFGPNIFGHLIFGQKISDKIFQDFGQNFGHFHIFPRISDKALWNHIFVSISYKLSYYFPFFGMIRKIMEISLSKEYAIPIKLA